ncbi:HupE/UreJ family protein [Actinoplanes sp. NPDC051851]|uniref:HupE/UreJ family protein n=1 Tax=Actinoplanes sp. NPDC051851 TaxID=3154753 RepID=UPI003423B5D1
MYKTRILRLLAGIAVAVPAALLLGASPASAHPMPHSVVLLDVHETSVTAELEIPLGDLTAASKIDDVTGQEDALRAYLTAHIKPVTTDGRPWSVSVGDISVTEAEQTSTGPYQELDATAVLTPPAGADIRHFTFDYDVVVHQVVTHTVLVSVRQDWATGKLAEDDDSATQVGTIKIDVRSMTVPALEVNLESGSTWSGFVAMVKLGGNHILEGTDHLLFLLILLLPAPLLAAGGRWREIAGARTAVARIGKTTLAFTIGHSVALAVSAFTHLDIPAWPVESFIAASILVGAIHAIRPIFPGREAAVAGFFGLGHGMAFSFVLAEMQLSTGRLALSLFGFNLGIELVQLFLVALALPAIVVVARSRYGRVFRITGASVTGVAATGWLIARLGVDNPVARAADSVGTHTTGMLIALTVAAIASLAWTYADRRNRVVPPPAPAKSSAPSGKSSAPSGKSSVAARKPKSPALAGAATEPAASVVTEPAASVVTKPAASATAEPEDEEPTGE